MQKKQFLSELPLCRRVTPVDRLEDTTNFSAEQLESMRYAFQLLDPDASGAISVNDVAHVVAASGIGASDNDTELLKDVLYGSGNINIGFAPLCTLISRLDQALKMEHLLEPYFDQFDIDRNGTIDIDELRKTLKDIGMDASASTVDAMMHEMDENGDKVIDYQEFVKSMRRNILTVDDEHALSVVARLTT